MKRTKILQEKRIEFETSKLLKKLDFNLITGGYWHDGVELMFHETSRINNNAFPNTYEAPTLSGLAQWLRNEHGIHVSADCNHSGWFWEMQKTNGTSIKWSNDRMWHEIVSKETYDLMTGQWWEYNDAFEDGLYEALTMIKNGYKG